MHFFLLMRFKKTQIETTLKGNNVKTFVKRSNCENLVLYIFEKVQKITAFFYDVYFVFSNK